MEPDVPPEVMERIAATVRQVLDTPELARFALGRSDRPEAECRELRADAVVEVFRSEDEEEAGRVELELARRFATSPKWRDLAPIRGAGARVFVALWAVEDIDPAG